MIVVDNVVVVVVVVVVGTASTGAKSQVVLSPLNRMSSTATNPSKLSLRPLTNSTLFVNDNVNIFL